MQGLNLGVLSFERNLVSSGTVPAPAKNIITREERDKDENEDEHDDFVRDDHDHANC